MLVKRRHRTLGAREGERPEQERQRTGAYLEFLNACLPHVDRRNDLSRAGRVTLRLRHMLVDDKALEYVAQHLRVRDRPLDNRQPLQRSVVQELQHGAIGVN